VAEPAGASPGLPGVKICGVTRPVDAQEAERAGASWIGVVLVPSSPRAVDPAEARRIMEGVELPLVVVVADLEPELAARAAARAGAAVVQLHGEEPPDDVPALRAAGVREVWKALRMREPAQLEEGIARYGGIVDGILVEGWHPTLRGGAGVPFDWGKVAPLRNRLPSGVRFIAAGGLEPGNVAEAVRLLRPDAVDVSTGVEPPGRPGIKDPVRVRSFISAARAAGLAE
jgi:phosphoribosylanthranilate isomerase